MSGMRKPPPEPSVPSENLTGEVGGINCGGDMGVRRCLARFLTSLALLRTPKSANGPRSNSFRPDSPLRQPTIRGRKAQPAHTHHTEHGPFRTRPPFSTKIHHINPSHKEFLFQFIILRKLCRRHNREPLFHILSCRITLPAENFKV